jgi:adenine-specific DNA-methyltransferase
VASIKIARTELVWPGKYDEDGTRAEVPRISLPFQVIETVNESRATREANKDGVQGTLFDVYEGKEGDTFEAGWRNKLIWGDNLLVMGSLLEKFAGKIDLIYIDPPFATGADFSFTAEIGDAAEEFMKDQSIIEEKAYRDTWGEKGERYTNWLFQRLALMRDLLSEKGSIFVHVDYRKTALVRLLLDEVFGEASFVNEIVWWYKRWSAAARTFQRMHDVLLFYAKTPRYTFNQLYQPLAASTQAVHGDTRRINVMGDAGKLVTVRTDQPSQGVQMHDVWEIPFVVAHSQEQLNYPTQKPVELMGRIIDATTAPGDLVADFFCGSGPLLGAAEGIRVAKDGNRSVFSMSAPGRRWIGCDLGRWSTHVTRKRLLGIGGCKPFELLNLGKYERKYWQVATFGDLKGEAPKERALFEYLAFILRLYSAQPVAGLAQLHGKKGKAMVHIGAVDAPVTISEIDLAVDECAQLKQGELHVLGWEWEMGLYDLMVEAAKKKGVKLLLFIIPREVMEQEAAATGDVRFYELAYLEADILQPKKLTAHVALKDFVIPNAELMPDAVRSKVTKWSDYIDYWAVDWDFQDDTFMQGWVAYRTRKNRKLPLTSDPHTYEKAGRYRILVKVIDVFGNDTSQAFAADVK